MTAERLIAALERGRTAWLLPLIAAALAVGPALTWSVPDKRGVPFVAVWAVGVVIGAIAVGTARRRWPSALEATVVVVAAAVIVGDVTALATQVLRDLGIYLRAGHAWTAGQPVYLDHLLTAVPEDRSLYPFNYPPVTLPFFGALATLPEGVVDVAWPAGSALLALIALRSFGLAWRWAILALLWRPIAEGLWVGNVAVPLLAAFALAPRAGALLALPGLVKVYAGIPALWLLRERRWRDVALAAAIVGGLVIGTLPLVGVEAWRAWLTGLPGRTRGLHCDAHAGPSSAWRRGSLAPRRGHPDRFALALQPWPAHGAPGAAPPAAGCAVAGDRRDGRRAGPGLLGRAGARDRELVLAASAPGARCARRRSFAWRLVARSRGGRSAHGPASADLTARRLSPRLPNDR